MKKFLKALLALLKGDGKKERKIVIRKKIKW